MNYRGGYTMTVQDIVNRYSGGPYKPRPEVKAYACSYGLGCEGPDCAATDCPRKTTTQTSA